MLALGASDSGFESQCSDIMIAELSIYLLISVIFNLVLFALAYILKTDKLTDLSYSITFILLATISFFNMEYTSIWDVVLLVLITLWALRLGGYLYIRIRKIGKDKRFDGIRENFLKFGVFWLIQGISVWVIIIPSIIFFSSNKISSIWITIVGGIIFLVGLIIETIADIQKYRYIENAKINNLGRHWVNTGLWKYSRHPNYLGEILLWAGIYLYAIAKFDILTTLFALVGPIYIFTIIRFFSGIPKLEKKADQRYGDNEEYVRYKEETGLILPKF
jgi:steroid 5-alpha reductase family enzyme